MYLKFFEIYELLLAWKSGFAWKLSFPFNSLTDSTLNFKPSTYYTKHILYKAHTIQSTYYRKFPKNISSKFLNKIGS